MTRVDLLLDPNSAYPSPFQCVIPDKVAVKGLTLQIKVGGENRSAIVYNILEPLIAFDFLIDDKTLQPV